jgi:hypothetical protein
LIGLGAAGTVERLTVEWPSGDLRVQHFEGLSADRYYRIVQGNAKAQEVSPCAAK